MKHYLSLNIHQRIWFKSICKELLKTDFSALVMSLGFKLAINELYTQYRIYIDA